MTGSSAIESIQMFVTANTGTWLKLKPLQSSELTDTEKQPVEKGRQYAVEEVLEHEVDPGNPDDPDELKPSSNGHLKIRLAYGAGERYIFIKDWDLEPQVIIKDPVDVSERPNWDQIDWTTFDSRVSRYFTVGEVTNMSRERLPLKADGAWSAQQIQQNIVRMARALDEIREEWGGPLAVNSFYRPWRVNSRIGSRSDNHPSGLAADYRPMDGRSVKELQDWFQREWYNKGRWNGGLGLGAAKGFLHCDLNPRFGKRIWNY